MHEHSLADTVVQAVEARRREAGAEAVARAVVRVSELSAISAASLQMMVDHAAEEMEVASFPVEVLKDCLLGHCAACGVVALTDDLTCTGCGSSEVPPAADEALLLVRCEFD